MNFIRQIFPRQSLFDSRLRVDKTKTVIIADVVASAVGRPVFVGSVYLNGRFNQNLLNVAPGQTGIGIEHQSDNAGNNRSGG